MGLLKWLRWFYQNFGVNFAAVEVVAADGDCSAVAAGAEDVAGEAVGAAAYIPTNSC